MCPSSTLSFNAFKTVIDIDLIGTFNVTKAAFDASLKQNGGVVLNITATLHYKGDLLQAHAGAAKAAIGMSIALSFNRKLLHGFTYDHDNILRWFNSTLSKRMGRVWSSSQLYRSRAN